MFVERDLYLAKTRDAFGKKLYKKPGENRDYESDEENGENAQIECIFILVQVLSTQLFVQW